MATEAKVGKVQTLIKVGVDEEYSSQFKSTKIEDPESTSDFYYGLFPEGFLLGAATSATQVEGGYNADGKGESMWDYVARTMPEVIEDGSNANEGCDSYNRWKDDVRILKEMNANVYRFSINWTRILPTGEPDNVNQAGIDYYNNLIDSLLANGIEPVVTLYHWDVPQVLLEKVYLLDEKIVDYFLHLARVCFKSFADRVKYWITINEPWLHGCAGFDLGLFPPFIKEPKSAYIAIHNLLKSHAAIYRLYEKEYKSKYNGKIGLSFDSWGFEPMDPENEEDRVACERQFTFKVGLIVDPLVTGDYPAEIREVIDKKAKEKGVESWLPQFDAEWSKKLKGSFDYLGLNHYTCEMVTTLERAPPDVTRVLFSLDPECGLHADSGNFAFHQAEWVTGRSWWMKHTPWALRPLLRRIKEKYGNLPIMITENGWSDEKETLDDPNRLNCMKAYLNELLKAVAIDNCNIIGYCAWTLLDCWEWNAGHSVSFGLHHVDLKDPKRKRTPRLSAKYLSDVYKNRGFIKQSK